MQNKRSFYWSKQITLREYKKRLKIHFEANEAERNQRENKTKPRRSRENLKNILRDAGANEAQKKNKPSKNIQRDLQKLKHEGSEKKF